MNKRNFSVITIITIIIIIIIIIIRVPFINTMVLLPLNLKKSKKKDKDS